VATFRYDTTDPAVRRAVGKHFEAAAQAAGVPAHALGAYFDACAAAAAPVYGASTRANGALLSAPPTPPGFRSACAGAAPVFVLVEGLEPRDSTSFF
jgi:hypothetical protein